MADVLEIHDGREEEFAADEEEDRMYEWIICVYIRRQANCQSFT